MTGRIAVVTGDPVTSRMAGPAIRAWHMAQALAREHDVRLVSTMAADRTHADFDIAVAGEDGLREVEAWCDVIVFQGGLLHSFPFLQQTNKVLVADVYDPFHLENFEGTAGEPTPERFATISRLTRVINEQLLRGDFFLCASARQRDFWLGSLAALGRVNPATYDADPHLRALIDVVPFGVGDAPPVAGEPVLRGVVDGIGANDSILLWAGGVYDWFDPLTLVHAVDRLRADRPDLRLVFLGMQHPHPHIPPMRMATELRALSDKLGLTGRHVFFNEGWVDYDRRAGYLLEADVGVSCHLDHIETAFSFRTRLLDHLWSGLPTVATTGDSFADLIEREQLGATAPPRDPVALAAAIERTLQSPPTRAYVQRVAEQFRWERVLEPLLAFCRDPRRAPDAGLAVTSLAEQVPSRPRWRLRRRRHGDDRRVQR